MVLALAACGACASSGQGATQMGPETVSRVFIPGGSGTEMYNEPGVGSRLVDAPLDSVWLALPKVYELLGIPDAGADSEQMTFGNLGYRARRVEGKRLSNYIDCGMGSTAIPKADDYQVTLSVLTRLTPGEDGGTMAVTTVEATGKPRAVSGNPVYCQSKGTLEARVAQLVLWVLVGGDPVSRDFAAFLNGTSVEEHTTPLSLPLYIIRPTRVQTTMTPH